MFTYKERQRPNNIYSLHKLFRLNEWHKYNKLRDWGFLKAVYYSIMTLHPSPLYASFTMCVVCRGYGQIRYETAQQSLQQATSALDGGGQAGCSTAREKGPINSDAGHRPEDKHSAL